MSTFRLAPPAWASVVVRETVVEYQGVHRPTEPSTVEVSASRRLGGGGPEVTVTSSTRTLAPGPPFALIRSTRTLAVPGGATTSAVAWAQVEVRGSATVSVCST